MTKAERDELRADAQRKAGKPVTAAAKVAEDKAIAKARAEDLDDPQTQAKIEMPETIEIVLHLADGDRAALISTSFTHEQVYDWDLYEDLQSFEVMLRGELNAAQVRATDASYAAAVTTSRMRGAVRRILAKITSYKEPWKTEDARGREVWHVRPTEQELREGIVRATGEPDIVRMRDYANILYGMYALEVERQKNARAAAVPG